MKKHYTLEEVRNIAAGAYSQGYLDAYDPDDETDLDNLEEVDFLISAFAEIRSKNERRICILS